MAVDFYLTVRGPILKQVESKVDARDISCLINVFDGTQFDPQFMPNNRVLISKITARAEQLTQDKNKQLKSNMMILAEKVKTFTPWECYVLQEEIHRRMRVKS